MFKKNREPLTALSLSLVDLYEQKTVGECGDNLALSIISYLTCPQDKLLSLWSSNEVQ